MESRPAWDDYFGKIAEVVSSRATCKRRKIGVVIVDKEHHIISTGYNGSPPGQPHCNDVGCLLIDKRCRRTIHGDVNSIIHCQDRNALIGSTMYIYGGSPCTPCAQAIVSARITRVVCSEEYPEPQAIEFLKQANIEVVIKK